MGRKRARSSGSFLFRSTGQVEYIGSGGGANQVVTYNPDNRAMESTDIDELVAFVCVSQLLDKAPDKRPLGDDLEIGDLWTDSNSYLMHIYNGSDWVAINSANGNPTGTIISTVIDGLTQPAPAGYLRCDGSPCPPQYKALYDLLEGGNLPSLGAGSFIKI